MFSKGDFRSSVMDKKRGYPRGGEVSEKLMFANRRDGGVKENLTISY